MFTKPPVTRNLGGVQERTLDSEEDPKSKWTTGPRRCQGSHRAAVSTVRPPLQGTRGDPVGPHHTGQSHRSGAGMCEHAHTHVCTHARVLVCGPGGHLGRGVGRSSPAHRGGSVSVQRPAHPSPSATSPASSLSAATCAEHVLGTQQAARRCVSQTPQRLEVTPQPHLPGSIRPSITGGREPRPGRCGGGGQTRLRC